MHDVDSCFQFLKTPYFILFPPLDAGIFFFICQLYETSLFGAPCDITEACFQDFRNLQFASWKVKQGIKVINSCLSSLVAIHLAVLCEFYIWMQMCE